ncbi:DUF3870 domain-containing protein [Peptoniphilus sp. MSJ-1]|uniref:DUF3870 domain-containing protein n=1 Tax=Peptoniphilus ovalis TaxID=2841503 RepID=A0ABS6FDN9_9FIRM|nr:DUF3870 domain-containing protein [Peptoniphilus ovalis]MBU5668301.1 DUF3870 domain-containing protein [Peptoniphilus ovalis]
MNYKTIYITGEARTNLDNAITKIYGIFYMAFEIDTESEKILNTDCNATLELTRDFIKNIFNGKKFIEDEKVIIHEITNRYFASSDKAIVFAYRDALRKYKNIKN